MVFFIWKAHNEGNLDILPLPTSGQGPMPLGTKQTCGMEYSCIMSMVPCLSSEGPAASLVHVCLDAEVRGPCTVCMSFLWWLLSGRLSVRLCVKAM